MIRDIIEFDNRINQHDQITPSRRRRAIATPQTPKICEAHRGVPGHKLWLRQNLAKIWRPFSMLHGRRTKRELALGVGSALTEVSWAG